VGIKKNLDFTGTISVVFLLFAFLCNISPAYSDYSAHGLHPMCKDRITHTDIFGDGLSKQEAYQRAHKDNIGWESHNIKYKQMFKNLANSLDALNSELTNRKSPFFEELENCRNPSGYKCGALFQKNNFGETHPLVQNLFCDQSVLLHTLVTIYEHRKNKINQCEQLSKKMGLEIKKETSGNISKLFEKIDLDLTCFDRDEETQSLKVRRYLKNYERDMNYLYYEFGNLKKLIAQKIKHSIIPEAIAYFLKAGVEEFEDPKMIAEKRNNLRRAYAAVDLANVVGSCCEDAHLLSQYDMSRKNLNLFSMQLLENHDEKMHEQYQQRKYFPLKFEIKDQVSKAIFQLAEGERWKTYFDNSVRVVPLKKQNKYFEFLKNNPFFLHPNYPSFDEYIRVLKESGRKDMMPKLTKDSKVLISEYDKMRYIQDSYQEQGYAQALNYTQPTSVNLKNPEAVVKNFIFDLNFQNFYFDDLQSKLKKQEAREIEEDKGEFYPGLFHGFLPHHFMRVGSQKILRELQKIPATDLFALQKKESQEYFVNFGRKVLCKDSINPICTHNKHDAFITTKLESMFKDLPELTKSFPEHESQDQKAFIYTQNFVDNLNKHVREINDTCHGHYTDLQNQNPEIKKTIKADVIEMNKLLQAFFSTKGLSALLSQNEFFELLSFSPSSAIRDCFTAGKVFDISIQNFISNPYGIGGTQTTSKKISLSDIQSIESGIEDSIAQEMKLIRDVYYYENGNVHDMEVFFKESMSIRLFSMLDYAKANPSLLTGKYFCKLLKSANEDDRAYRELLHISIGLGTGVTTLAIAYFAPSLIKGSIMVKEFLSAVLITTVSGYAAWYGYDEVQDRVRDISLSAAVDNLMYEDATFLHEYENLSGAEKLAWQVLIFNAAMGGFAVVTPLAHQASRSVYAKIVSNLTDVLKSARKLQLEEYIQRASINGKFLALSRKAERSLLNSRRVNPGQFRDFLKFIDGGEYTDELASILGPAQSIFHNSVTWAGRLDKAVKTLAHTMDDVIQGGQKKQPTAIERRPGSSSYKSVSSLPQKGLFAKTWYKTKADTKTLRTKLSLAAKQFSRSTLNTFKFYKLSPTSRLSNETKTVKLLNHFEEQTKKTGRPLIKQATIDKIKKSLQHYTWKNGIYILNSTAEVSVLFDDFVSQVIKQNSLSGEFGDVLKAKLAPLFKSKLLDAADIKKITQKVGDMGPLKTHYDIMALGEVIRFYSKMQKMPIVINDIGTYIRMAKNALAKSKLHELKAYHKICKAHGLSKEEFIELFGEMARDFPVTIDMQALKHQMSDEAFKHYGNVITRDKVWIKDIMQKKHYKPKTFFEDQVATNKFLDDISENLILANRSLSKKDLVKSLFEMNTKRSIYHMSKQQCDLPDSVVRKSSDRDYVNLAAAIAATTAGYGFINAHSHEEKNGEWFGKLGYEIVLEYIAGKFIALFFVNQGNARTIGKRMKKMSAEYLIAMPIASTFHLLGYNTANKYYWDTDQDKFEEFTKELLSAAEPSELLDDYFKANPKAREIIDKKIEAMVHIYEQFDNDNADSQEEDDKLRKLFLRQGLITSIFPEDEAMDNSLLRRALHDAGYTDDLFATIPRTDEQEKASILNAITLTQYNQLYDKRSPMLKGPGGIELMDMSESALLGHYWKAWDVMLQREPTDGLRLGHTSIPKFVLNSDPKTIDRIAFYTAFFTPIASVGAYIKNEAVTSILCNMRFGHPNAAYALLVHATYRSVVDPLDFSLRQYFTGS